MVERNHQAAELIDKWGKHLIKIEYCGGWGERRYVDEAIDQIERRFPKQFNFKLIKDSRTTGRFEVTLFLNKKNPSVSIFSRLKSGKRLDFTS